MLTVGFVQSTMSGTQVKLCYNRLREGREDINDYARTGRPKTSTANENTEGVKKMILNNHRITIREVADDVGLPLGSCQAIFTHVLDMKRASAQTVPKLLNFEQKQCCMDFAQMLTTFNDNPDLLKNVVTSNESWVCGYDIENEASSSHIGMIKEIK